MLSDKIFKIAQELNEKLRKYEKFIGLYFYGSQVKGKALPDSDIDIVALFKDDLSLDMQYQVHGESLELELEHDVVIDFHPMTEDELKGNPAFYDEVRKGVYYAA